MTISDRIDRLLLRLSGAKSGKPFIKMRQYPYPLKSFIKGNKRVDISDESGKYVTKISKDGSNGRAIIYLHGGGYKDNFNREHWRFVDKISSAVSYDVFALDYPLLPDNFERAYAYLDKVYNNVLEDYGEIVFMGDSAGGGLAIGYAAYLKDKGIKTPDKIIAISPWLDLTLENPEIAHYDKKDPMLNVEALRKNGREFSSPSTPENAYLSPVYADIDGLGEIYIFFGDCDILCPDGIKFSEKTPVGTKIKFDLKKNMLHDYPILPVKGAEYAFKKIVRILSK